MVKIFKRKQKATEQPNLEQQKLAMQLFEFLVEKATERPLTPCDVLTALGITIENIKRSLELEIQKLGKK